MKELIARLIDWWMTPPLPLEYVFDRLYAGLPTTVKKRDVGVIMGCAQKRDLLPCVRSQTHGEHCTLRICDDG